MFDRAAVDHDLIWAHRRVADEDDLVVGGIGIQHLPGVELIGVAPGVVLPDALIEAIVEVVVFEVLEFGPRRENNSSTSSMWSSIEPPMSKNIRSFTALCRSARSANVEIAFSRRAAG